MYWFRLLSCIAEVDELLHDVLVFRVSPVCDIEEFFSDVYHCMLIPHNAIKALISVLSSVVLTTSKHPGKCSLPMSIEPRVAITVLSPPSVQSQYMTC